MALGFYWWFRNVVEKKLLSRQSDTDKFIELRILRWVFIDCVINSNDEQFPWIWNEFYSWKNCQINDSAFLLEQKTQLSPSCQLCFNLIAFDKKILFLFTNYYCNLATTIHHFAANAFSCCHFELTKTFSVFRLILKQHSSASISFEFVAISFRYLSKLQTETRNFSLFMPDKENLSSFVSKVSIETPDILCIFDNRRITIFELRSLLMLTLCANSIESTMQPLAIVLSLQAIQVAEEFSYVSVP